MALIETIPAKEDYRRKMAYKLMMEGTDASPVQHWAQGLARLGQGALGGYEMYQADQKDKETEAGNNAALIAALQGGGMSAPSSQPTPQQPTAQPMPPVSSVTPSAGAVPAALSGARPGGPVMPSNKWWGDGEGEAAGLYEKPAASPKIAANGPVALPPQPAAPAAAPAAAAPPAAVPSPTEPQMADAKARLVQMLQSDNPQMRKLGQNMAQTMIASQLAGDKPTDEVREFQYAEKNPAFKQYKIDLKKAGSTNVTTNVGGGSDKQIFDAMEESAKGARTTAAGLTGLREARSAIEGGAITGFRADNRLSLQKAGAFFGVADPGKIVNTETFKAAIAPQVAAVLKSTVGTANISNTDREFAEKAAGGNIELDEKSITRLLGIMEKASVGQLEAHQKRLEKIYSDPEKFGRERALFGVEMPAVPARPPAAAPKVDLKKKYGLD
jgi:hypothetical protein